MTVGRAFMAIEEKQPTKALMHYDLAISKRMNSEDRHYFRKRPTTNWSLRETGRSRKMSRIQSQSPEIHAFQNGHPVRNGRFKECL